ncbi:hypothetical protein [Geobacter sp. DSM 9736]|uniref:hypothetical protein n=1 Tax=Geobacter sp. DSM 9736 TaxID=1277350 RepID=UPI000B50134D|nr:hypothetical protein [Geobacter sp. DSM 9736]SNB47610.1 hypothetical protein SAMN06269301_3101 [Geobacter sp. DSM 9736]
MLEQAIKQLKQSDLRTPCTSACKHHNLIPDIQREIDSLYASSRRGLWNLAAFLLISILFLLIKDIAVLDLFPEHVREIIGAPPAPYLIHIILGVSTISGLIIVAGRLLNDVQPGRKYEQLAHRSAFYIFYLLSSSLPSTFLFVFSAGVAVLLLEHYQISAYYKAAICWKKELMRKASLWPLTATGRILED